MKLVALAWARMGWAKFLRGENLAAMQFLNSAWLLSESGTVANRLGQVYEKQGQHEKARHMYALAVVAGGADVADSRDRLDRVARTPGPPERADFARSGVGTLMSAPQSAAAGDSGSAASSSTDKEIAQAKAELVESRTVKLEPMKLDGPASASASKAGSQTASARFNLVFDSSPRPERAEFVDGDESLRPAGEQMREKDFPVRFPDASSIKIVRRGAMSCGSSGCAVELLPIEQVGAGASAK